MQIPADSTKRWTSPAQWEKWLAHHHDQSAGVWLLIAKKIPPAVRSRLARHLMLRFVVVGSTVSGRGVVPSITFSATRPGSPWSKLNVERAEALILRRRMRKPGLEAIAKAKADGRWDVAYVSQRTAKIPPDFTTALQKNKRAATAFASLSKTGRYARLLPLLKATTAAIRLARLKKIVAKLEAASD